MGVDRAAGKNLGSYAFTDQKIAAFGSSYAWKCVLTAQLETPVGASLLAIF